MNKVNDGDPTTNVGLKPFEKKVHELIKGMNGMVC